MCIKLVLEKRLSLHSLIIVCSRDVLWNSFFLGIVKSATVREIHDV